MSDEDIVKTLEGYRHEIGSLKHRLADMEKIVEAVHGLAAEMASQTTEMRHMNESIKLLNEDVAELKAKPANRWDQIVGTFIGGAVGVVVAHFFN